MPSDVTGSSVFNQREADFEFRPGPIFANLLLADEINRAPPKTQAALLEAMQERQVTTEGETRRLGPPFLVLATQNPIEYEGTYPLPEAQLDRFLLRMSVGYPAREDEWQVLADRAERRQDEVVLEPARRRRHAARAAARARGRARRRSRSASTWSTSSRRRATRSRSRSAPRPRGSLALLKLSRCRAALDGRDFVTPDDVKAVAVPALAHRLTLRPELWVQRVSAEDVVRERLETVPTPAAEDLATGVTRCATPKLAAYAALAGRRAARCPRLRAGPSSSRSTAPFLLALAAGLALADAAAAAARLVELDRDRALEGDEVGARIVARVGDAGRPPRRSTSACPRARARATAGTRSRSASQPASSASSSCTSARDRWGGHVLGPVTPRARPARLPRLGVDARDAAAAAGLSARGRRCGGCCAPRETQVFSRQRGLAAQGRRHRVRRHPAVRARRSA